MTQVIEVTGLPDGFGDYTTEFAPQTLLELLTRLGSERTALLTVNPNDAGVANGNNLNALVATLQTQYGGGTIVVPTVWQPANETSYESWGVTGNIQLGGQVAGESWNGIVRGTSGNASILKNDATDLFDVMNLGGASTIGGTLFSDLQIRYAHGAQGAGAAIMYENGNQHRSQRLYFKECPFGIVFQNILEGVTRDGKVEFNNQTNGVGISVTGVPGDQTSACNQITIAGYTFLDTGSSNNTNIGVLLTQCNHLTLADTVIQGMGGGSFLCNVTATKNNDTIHTILHNVQASSPSGAAAVGFYVAGTLSALYDTRVTNSFFQSGNASTWTQGNMVIGTPSNGNALIDLFYVHNTSSCASAGGNGFDVNQGEHIWFSFCAAQGNVNFGVNIVGGTHLHFAFLDLTPVYGGSTAGGGGSNTQVAAMKFANASAIDVFGCDASGYASGFPAFLFGTGGTAPTDVRAYYNRGYNDTTPQLCSAFTCPNGLPFNNQTINAAGWWGPADYWIDGSGTITSFLIANNVALTGPKTVPVSARAFHLEPYQTAQISYTGTITLTAIGH